MNNWERWIVYPLCGICILLTLCSLSWRIGADKSGMVVGVLSILVTFLVGWQIWQTIKAKEELNEYKQKFDEISAMEKRLEDVENQLRNLSQNNSPKTEQAHQKETPSVQINLPQSVIDFVHTDMAKKNTPLWEWLSSMVDGIKSDADILREYDNIKVKNPKKIAYIDGRLASNTEVVALLEEIRPIRLMILNALKGKSNKNQTPNNPQTTEQ